MNIPMRGYLISENLDEMLQSAKWSIFYAFLQGVKL